MRGSRGTTSTCRSSSRFGFGGGLSATGAPVSSRIRFVSFFLTRPAAVGSASAWQQACQNESVWSASGAASRILRPARSASTARIAMPVVFPPRRPAQTTFLLARLLRKATCLPCGRGSLIVSSLAAVIAILNLEDQLAAPAEVDVGLALADLLRDVVEQAAHLPDQRGVVLVDRAVRVLAFEVSGHQPGLAAGDLVGHLLAARPDQRQVLVEELAQLPDPS